MPVENWSAEPAISLRVRADHTLLLLLLNARTMLYTMYTVFPGLICSLKFIVVPVASLPVGVSLVNMLVILAITLGLIERMTVMDSPRSCTG